MNASLFGFLEEVLPDHEVYGVINGLQGLVEDRLLPLAASAVDRYRQASEMPGAWLGAGRWPVREENFEQYVIHLKNRNIGKLALIGGNGTMWACLQLERAARRMGHELAVLGIPKTVDNDLAGTDHAPGFGSAARFVATIVRDVGKDLESMQNFEAVRVLETMGRNVGWLAMSSGYLKRGPEDPPHLIYVPEREFAQDRFLKETREAYQTHGYAVVVVSEGLPSGATDNHMESPILGGVSRELARLVTEELGLPARGELLGMGQRSYSLAVSRRDWQEARLLGAEVARMLRAEVSGVMLGLKRAPSSHYEAEIRSVPFDRVAGVERPLPTKWLSSPDTANEEYRRWLEPLVGEDLAGYPGNLTGEVKLSGTGP
jgi:ATP-dependent phosphofructokinase / diphosphate-dependent phosphofructokinase